MEHHYVDALKNNDDTLIKELYGRHRAEFFGFSRKYRISEIDSADIYQEAFLAMRKHAISGKLNEVSCSFKTYLFGIGKYLIFDIHKAEASKSSYNANLHNTDSDYESITVDITQELTEEQKLLRHFFNQLGKSCQQMLTLSFYRGLTNEEIAKQYGYESEAVVRSQKSRCLKTLKNLIKTSPR
ncbi:RNA polymerase sigma factor [Gelidibacter maritimus]|uniref:Sigma-70 family RNA polymerase sigma factor n=1 Tax=Gelidibacter maritimus TaxID=2761487 RepID=A0A7W2R3S8_9FLAO|nr:sigma-70 family RNA polymerase sigma factor [Gelidibacter maritimus]MBA6153161.1 sigma-70 family RNA polymerase sigma factor [Gelidibacter maritimus]